VLTCMNLDRPMNYTVLYNRPAFAQKQAQNLWNRLAQENHLDWSKRIMFLQAGTSKTPVYSLMYDVIFRWVQFTDFNHPLIIDEIVKSIADSLRVGGLAFVVGPPEITSLLRIHGLRLVRNEQVKDLSTFRLHQSILPRAHIKDGLMLSHAMKD
jgi:hypothetical protein